MFQVLLIFLQLTIVVVSQQAQPFCVIDNTTSPYPPLPKLPDQYQTIIEVNIVDKNFSLTAFEYFDYVTDKAALTTERNGVKSLLLFDYNTDELFDIRGLSCMINDLKGNNNNILFGNTTINSMPHVFTTGGVMRFSKSFGEEFHQSVKQIGSRLGPTFCRAGSGFKIFEKHYKGTSVVRGIKVDHWQSCLHWPLLKSTFILDYYFTVASWSDPVRYPQIPVRAVAKGQRLTDDGTTANFLHYYDYIDFKPVVDDPSVFETPEGVVCRGRKQLKPVPQIPGFYHFRQQITRTNMPGTIFNSDVWYDFTYKLLRRDYKMPFQVPPLNTLNPITEVHDFNSGVKYVQDQLTKQCKFLSLANDTHDVGVTANQSYSVFMKDPMQFFQLNSSYRYAGQRTTRGILCDVFSIVRFDIDQFQNQPAVVEYYFLAESLSEYPDDGPGVIKHAPVLMLVNVPNAGYQERVEFIDFDYGHPSLDVFDVMACYSESAKLQFTVKFAGQYKTENHNKILNQARQRITQAMGVMPIRIQAPKLKYDNSFVYISAMLLDRSPYEAQFTLISEKKVVNQDDYTFPSIEVSSMSDCAKVCVEYSSFTCNSFDYCEKNPNPCKISKAHVGDGKTVLMNSTCDHFSRTVTGPPVPELTMYAAYTNLTTAVYQDLMQLSIDIPFSLNRDIYTAVDVSVIFGWLYPQGVPFITGQFSLHEEITVPSSQKIMNIDIWYDYEYQLVRFDGVFTVPVSRIHDFNAGLSYIIDKTTGGCVISPLLSETFDVTVTQLQKSSVIKLKNPLQLFHLNNNYKYSGQKSIRGIVCDVYENTLPFNFGTDVSQPALYQLYFMTQGWHEVSAESGVPVTSQPVKVVISATDSSKALVYDIYDFNEEHPDLSNFNIQPCFHGNGKDFLIKFNQTYHPMLERYLKDFQKQVQMILSSKTRASPLRFQNPQITNSPEFTYYLGTMVEQPTFLLEFTKTINYVGVYSSDASYTDVSSDAECAKYCQNLATVSKVTCNSFDYCPSTQLCQLSMALTPDGNKLNRSTICDHYSRTESGSSQVQPTVAEALTIIEDQIANSLLSITLQTKEYQNVTYPAILFDRDIVRFDRDTISSTTLSHFNRMKRSTVPGHSKSTIEGISVDDCAARCINYVPFECRSFDYCADIGLCAISDTHPGDGTVVPTFHQMCDVFSTRCINYVPFECRSFDYCADIGLCAISDTHPGDGTVVPTFNQMCDVFSRKYTDDYKEYPGQFINVYASAVIQNVNSADICAYHCSQNDSCKSFEYCANKMCYLKTEHILHIPPVLVASSLTCSHYSRNFIKDFKISPKKSLTSNQKIVVTGVSPEQCAELCVENAGFLCQTFTFCRNLLSCTIMGVNAASSISNIQDNSDCDLYTRQYFSTQTGHQFNNNSNNNSSPASESQGYSTGSMIGVGIGTLVTGIVLGAAILFIFQRNRHIKEQPMIEMGVQNKNYTPDNDQNTESES